MAFSAGVATAADAVSAFTVGFTVGFDVGTTVGFDAALLGPLATAMAITNSDATRTKVITAFVTRLANLECMSLLRLGVVRSRVSPNSTVPGTISISIEGGAVHPFPWRLPHAQRLVSPPFSARTTSAMDSCGIPGWL